MLVPITKEATVSCISMQDPAIDADKVHKEIIRGNDGKPLSPEPIAVYMRDRLRDPGSWRKTVPMKDGAKPTEFVIGVVPPSELNRIEDECRRSGQETHTNELAWRCFLHGVRDIVGIGLEVVYCTVGAVKYVDPQWLADVFCGRLRNVGIEIGAIVWHWNNLANEDVGN